MHNIMYTYDVQCRPSNGWSKPWHPTVGTPK